MVLLTAICDASLLGTLHDVLPHSELEILSVKAESTTTLGKHRERRQTKR